MRVTVAAVQATPVFLDTDATVEKACALIKDAADQGARLIVFPEAFVPTYPDWVWRLPAWADGRYTNRLYDQAVAVPGPLRDQEGTVVAEIDLAEIPKHRRLFDPVGHYARPDVFSLTVDTRPRRAVTFDDGAP